MYVKRTSTERNTTKTVVKRIKGSLRVFDTSVVSSILINATFPASDRLFVEEVPSHI